LITAGILAAGAFLWTGGTMVLGDGRNEVAAWSLGAEKALITIDMYSDFT